MWADLDELRYRCEPAPTALDPSQLRADARAVQQRRLMQKLRDRRRKLGLNAAGRKHGGRGGRPRLK